MGVAASAPSPTPDEGFIALFVGGAEELSGRAGGLPEEEEGDGGKEEG